MSSLLLTSRSLSPRILAQILCSRLYGFTRLTMQVTLVRSVSWVLIRRHPIRCGIFHTLATDVDYPCCATDSGSNTVFPSIWIHPPNHAGAMQMYHFARATDASRRVRGEVGHPGAFCVLGPYSPTSHPMRHIPHTSRSLSPRILAQILCSRLYGFTRLTMQGLCRCTILGYCRLMFLASISDAANHLDTFTELFLPEAVGIQKNMSLQ
jgi:hypothetical protein